MSLLIKQSVEPSQKAEDEYQAYLKNYGPLESFAKKIFENIISCRRKINTEHNFDELNRIVLDKLEYIIANFNYKWINSIIDTYIDCGDNDQKLQALILSQYMCNIVALLVNNGSTIKKYEYVGEFNHRIKRMNISVSDKFPNLFARIDNNITCEPFKSIWNKRLRIDLNNNKTSWSNIAWYSGAGIYYSVREKKNIPYVLNSKKFENLLIFGDHDDEFIYKILNNDVHKLIVIINDKSRKINDNRVKYHLTPETSFDFVWFGVNIESVPKWRSIKLNNRSIIAGINLDANEKTIGNIIDAQYSLGYKVDLRSLYNDKPFGWYVSTRNQFDLSNV